MDLASAAPTPAATASSTKVSATPYAINDHFDVSESAIKTAAANESVERNSSVLSRTDTKGSESFASEVAAVLAGSDPEPDAELVPEAVVAPSLVSDAIINKAASANIETNASSQPATAVTQQEEASLSTKQVITTAAAAAKVATYTPPELTRLQHNAFVSRPTDVSRSLLGDLDASAMPAPLQPLNRQKGLVRLPSHVVIFGWMDAPIRLVAKYAQPYTVLFPDATVLIVLSDGKSYLAREAVRREQLQLVIDEISATVADEKASGGIETKDVGDSTVTLIDHSEARSASSEQGGDAVPQQGGFVIHSFSDGGASNLALFLDQMSRRKGASPPVHSLIMDSSPGKANPKTGSVAFTMHLANRPRLRAFVRFFVYVGLYLLQIWTKVTGKPGRGELMRKRLNSLRSWSWVTASYTSRRQPDPNPTNTKAEAEAGYPPRMYMYTTADKLIPWQFVEEHAEQLASLRNTRPRLVEMEKQQDRQALLRSAQSGTEKEHDGSAEYKVELRRWDTPPHCSIGRSDFEGYWAAVMDFYANVLSRN